MSEVAGPAWVERAPPRARPFPALAVLVLPGPGLLDVGPGGGRRARHGAAPRPFGRGRAPAAGRRRTGVGPGHRRLPRNVQGRAAARAAPPLARVLVPYAQRLPAGRVRALDLDGHDRLLG